MQRRGLHSLEIVFFCRVDQVPQLTFHSFAILLLASLPLSLDTTSHGDNIDAKTDAGWKETLAKISEAHPDSELTKQYGKRKSAKDVKTTEVRKKHKTIAERRIKKVMERQ